MPDFLLDVIKDTVEYQNWGWNMMAVSVIGTVVCSIMVAQGLWRQNKNIWSLRSGESLSVVWFAYFIGMFSSAILYGFHRHSAGIVFNCVVLLVMHIPIIVGLWRFKTWSLLEKIQASIYIFAMPIAMFLIPYKEVTFIIFSLGMIYSVSTQPWEMWRNKSVGVVDARFILYQIASVTFWAIFAFTTKALALMILNPTLFVLFSVTLYFCFIYRASRTTAQA